MTLPNTSSDSRSNFVRSSALKPRHIYVPEGKGVTWDAATQAAVSDAYNTLHFTTPLIELPIDKITPAEQQEYHQFRTAYLNLWRQYFDPVGMRFGNREVAAFVA